MVYFFIFMLGLFFGSFANVCIWRIPKKQSILFPYSYCPRCRKHIKWYDNIPILSYIVLYGKCRYCGSKISLQYPLIEFLTATVFLLIFRRFRFENIGVIVVFLFFGLLLIIVSGIDFRHKIIPDGLSYSLMISGLLFSPFNSFLAISFSGTKVYGIYNLAFSFTSLVLAGGLLYVIALLGEKIFKKEAMGGGDIKLIAGIGGFIGIVNILWVIFLSSLLGGIIGGILLLTGKKKRLQTIPFGPYICIGTLLVVLSQPQLTQWYLSYFM